LGKFTEKKRINAKFCLNSLEYRVFHPGCIVYIDVSTPLGCSGYKPELSRKFFHRQGVVAFGKELGDGFVEEGMDETGHYFVEGSKDETAFRYPGVGNGQ